MVRGSVGRKWVGRVKGTDLADADEGFWDSVVETVGYVVILFNDHADEVGLVREALEKEQRVDRVAVVFEEGREKVRLSTYVRNFS